MVMVMVERHKARTQLSQLTIVEHKKFYSVLAWLNLHLAS